MNKELTALDTCNGGSDVVLREILGTSWADRYTNETDVNRKLIREIRRRQPTFFGHAINRKNL